MTNSPSSQSRAPIVCSLDGSTMKGRAGEWAALGRKALLERKPHQSGVCLRYRKQPDVRAELQRLVGLEGECCGFLTFDRVDRDGDLVLTISGPDESPWVKNGVLVQSPAREVAEALGAWASSSSVTEAGSRCSGRIALPSS